MIGFRQGGDFIWKPCFLTAVLTARRFNSLVT